MKSLIQGTIKQELSRDGREEQEEKEINPLDLIKKEGKWLQSLQQQLRQIRGTIRRPRDLETMFDDVVGDIRIRIGCDRALIYCFNSADQGEVLAEAKTMGWRPAFGETIPATAFGLDNRDDYSTQSAIPINVQEHITPYQSQLLEGFQVKACLSIPIILKDKVWGLLVVQQCDEVRSFTEMEIFLLNLIGKELEQAVERSQFQLQIQKLTEGEEAVIELIQRIRQSIDIENILKYTTQKARTLLKTDRVVVYRFNGDWSGQFVAESVGSGWLSLVELQENMIGENISDCEAIDFLVRSEENDGPKNYRMTDTYLQETRGGRFRYRETFAVEDIYRANLTDCYLEFLEQFQVKAYIVAPIFAGEQLWGMFGAYQHDGTRAWEDAEVTWMKQIGAQLGLALKQAEFLEQTEAQKSQLEYLAAKEQTLSRISTRILQSLEPEKVFSMTVREIRILLQCDRVGVFRFYPNSGYDDGEFVAEDKNPAYASTMAVQIHDHCFGDYVEKYRQGEVQAIADIHNAGLTDCHKEVLAQLGVVANLIVPLLQGEELWGFFCIHQCSGPREWKSEEIEFSKDVAAQFCLALEVQRTLQQLEEKSQLLSAAVAKEKAAKELLQSRALGLLTAVRPALDGNLTVRAPITDDELGTIAGAYNNTLQSWSKILLQVQEAARKVATTSQESDISLVQLTEQATVQFQEIGVALGKIKEMVNSTEAAIANAQLVENALQQANRTVESGDEAMNQTVQGIQLIRETVSQTSQKIKQLSESAHKISKAVGLIADLATQTNVVAFNAAIEATRAGEYGKGFAVVADEVRSLSRQSAAATSEIEKLVAETQESTMGVAAAMDLGIQQVVEGTNLVNLTRESLNEIVTATAQIERSVVGIIQATQQHKERSEEVTKVMNGVAQIADKTSTESLQISASFKELLQMAEELLVTADRFKVN